MDNPFDDATPTTAERTAIAERLVDLGFWLFTIRAGAKAPPPDQWWSTSTRDKATLAAWITSGANLAIDHAHFGPDGKLRLVTADLDEKDGKHGVAEWQRLAAEHGAAPRTFRQRSPSGGEHLVFVTDQELGNNDAALPEGH